MSMRIESLSKSFGGTTLFQQLCLDIPLDKPVVITGPSGCGKTTLLRIIAGLDRDYEGSVTGVPESISFMFQEDRLLPWQSVQGNIEFVLKDIMDSAQIHEAASHMIEAVQLSGHEHKRPAELSGGMKRRVALARTFCYPAKLLLLDEPFKGFDAKLNDEMLGLFSRLYDEQKRNVVLVTHDLAVTEKLDCHIIRLDEITAAQG